VKNNRIDGDVFAPVHMAIVTNVCDLLGADSFGGQDARPRPTRLRLTRRRAARFGEAQS
jgi:hypothetical protein